MYLAILWYRFSFLAFEVLWHYPERPLHCVWQDKWRAATKPADRLEYAPFHL